MIRLNRVVLVQSILQGHSFKAQQLEEVAGKLLQDKETGSTAAFDEYNGQLAAAEDEIAVAKKNLKP